MNDRGIAKLLDYLRRDAPPGPDLLPDSELLARFAANRDEAAFELLVRRHGPMVLGTARRALRDAHSAEDVFQATFLALARKSRSLRRGGAIAGWLHCVALRAALRVRKQQERIVVRAAPSVKESPTWESTELRAVLDEEVARLPERFRDAVVHCYLAGRTTEEAASALRCPRGTVLSRLAAARKRLQIRLTRRGYGLPAAGVAALWASESAPALTPTLLCLAVRAAGPATAIAPGILKLTEGALHAMMMTKLKIAAGFMLAVGLVGVGVGQIGAGPPGKEQPPTPKGDLKIASIEPQSRENDAAVERSLHDLLAISAKKRVDLRLRVEQGKDDVSELIRQKDEWLGALSRAEQNWIERQNVIDAMKKHPETVSEESRKQTEKERDFRLNELEKVKEGLAQVRHELMKARRDLFEAEEQLSLHDQLTQMGSAKLRRQLPQ